MIKRNQDGSAGLVISFVLTVILLISTLGFAGWAYSSRQDYKDNVDTKINDAVTIAKQQESTAKDKQFAEAEKQPLRPYHGPEAYGSIVVNYPKTWSAYVADTGNSNATLVDGYFHPSTVPSVTDQNSVFALRVQVLNQSYSQVLTSLAPQQKTGNITITPYALPQVPKVVGVRATGKLEGTKVGTVVLLPLRSETIKISTDGVQHLSDFNNIILPNFTFSP